MAPRENECTTNENLTYLRLHWGIDQENVKKANLVHMFFGGLFISESRVRNLLSYGKIYSKYPKDPSVKNHYNKLYREYTETRKYKCRQNRQSLIKQLETLHEENLKSYLKWIDKLQGIKNINKSEAI